ncbi:MAG TPA: aspartate aminotransferase family protein [Lachnospiraceae bacterium]|nr:aspartate aminotransferase family protein [Lachnospiraceae bacterium]
MSGQGNFGFVNGGLLPVAHAAEWLADTWNQNGALSVMSPVTAQIESVCEGWITELFGLEKGTAMGLVTGSSNAIICALAAARNTLLKRQGYDLAENGLRNAPAIRIVVGADAHSSVKAALSVLGFGKAETEIVPTDEFGRMKIENVPELDNHTLLILQAGNVNGGSYDPIDKLCDLAKERGAWVHIDGAFGLWAAASKKYRYLVKGMEKADSWSTDAHKTLNAGYDCGIVLCRHRDEFTAALQASGAYIQYGESRDGMLYTTEMSRRARAVPLWAVLKSLGAKGVEQLIDTLCGHAEHFAAGLQKAGFELVNPVFFNQFMVRCETERKTEHVLHEIQNSGICWCSGSKWKGESVIRVSICSHATTREDIDKSIRVFCQALH